LTQIGYKIINRNYHSRYGELDLIACYLDTLVIVEVKCRTGKSMKYAENSISLSKRKKITLTTLQFISENPDFKELSCRFDAIIIFYNKMDNTYKINHIPDAFLPIYPKSYMF
jgi:putative endonuclease